MHSISELKSALQKFIRRGMHREALAAANGLCDYMLVDEKQRDVSLFETFWARLHIIATEDIGIAQYGTHTYLEDIKAEARTNLFNSNKEGSDQAFRSACLRAVLTLSQSPKSRLTDNSYIYFERQPLISNVSYESLYRYIEKINEFSLLELIASAYRQRNDKKRHTIPSVNDIYHAIKARITTVDSNNDNLLLDEVESIWAAYQSRPCVLYLMHLALLLCRPPTQPVVVVSKLPPMTNMAEFMTAPLPDFVYDKHTRRGREILGRGFEHFVRIGSILENCHIPDPYYELLLEGFSSSTASAASTGK